MHFAVDTLSKCSTYKIGDKVDKKRAWAILGYRKPNTGQGKITRVEIPTEVEDKSTAL